MSGKLISIVHKCVPPNIEPNFGLGTIWECECGQRWELWEPPIISGVPYRGPLWGMQSVKEKQALDGEQ